MNMNDDSSSSTSYEKNICQFLFRKKILSLIFFSLFILILFKMAIAFYGLHEKTNEIKKFNEKAKMHSRNGSKTNPTNITTKTDLGDLNQTTISTSILTSSYYTTSNLEESSVTETSSVTRANKTQTMTSDFIHQNSISDSSHPLSTIPTSKTDNILPEYSTQPDYSNTILTDLSVDNHSSPFTSIQTGGPDSATHGKSLQTNASSWRDTNTTILSTTKQTTYAPNNSSHSGKVKTNDAPGSSENRPTITASILSISAHGKTISNDSIPAISSATSLYFKTDN